MFVALIIIQITPHRHLVSKSNWLPRPLQPESCQVLAHSAFNHNLMDGILCIKMWPRHTSEERTRTQRRRGIRDKIKGRKEEIVLSPSKIVRNREKGSRNNKPATKCVSSSKREMQNKHSILQYCTANITRQVLTEISRRNEQYYKCISSKLQKTIQVFRVLEKTPRDQNRKKRKSEIHIASSRKQKKTKPEVQTNQPAIEINLSSVELIVARQRERGKGRNQQEMYQVQHFWTQTPSTVSWHKSATHI